MCLHSSQGHFERTGFSAELPLIKGVLIPAGFSSLLELWLLHREYHELLDGV